MVMRVHCRDGRGMDEGMQSGALEDVRVGCISCVGCRVQGREAGWGQSCEVGLREQRTFTTVPWTLQPGTPLCLPYFVWVS